MSDFDLLPQTELLAQLAEECAELGQAALKLRRVLDGSNPTPVSYHDAKLALLEEAADVQLCMRTVHALADRAVIEDIIRRKQDRWLLRLAEARRLA